MKMTARRGTNQLKSIDPSTGKEIAKYPLLEPQELFAKIRSAASAADVWAGRTVEERAKKLNRVAKLLKDREDKYATLISREMGKPITQSRAEVQKCAWACSYFADNAADFLGTEPIETEATFSGIQYEPLGALLAIMPWNFPFWQVFRFAAPSLMAGNVVMLKHASDVPGCSLAIQEIFDDAGFPAGVFQSLLISTSDVKALIKHPVIKAVTLTGSERAGRIVAGEAGSALKKCVLELGGSDPFIVLDDANLEETILGAVSGRMQNAGQSCIAAKRFIVSKKISKKFIEGFVDNVKQLKVGDPLDDSTEIGPMVRDDILKDLEAMMKASEQRGAEILCGGKRRKGPGFFFEPTVMTKVKPGMEVFDEETFGPLAAITVVGSENEAVEMANRTRFGLGASIWSADVDRARDLAGRIEAGSVFINGIVKSDPRLPFGGIKASGYGRELARPGIHEFTNIKTLWVR